MTELFVSWSDYHRTIERLAGRLYDAGWPFDRIVALGRGGLRVGDCLSRLYRKPLAVMQAARGEDGVVAVSQHLAALEPALGGRVLLVDDLVDSGATLASAMHGLQGRCTELRTAVLWLREGAALRPDYHVQTLARDCRLHRPTEPYDFTTIDDLARRVRASS